MAEARDTFTISYREREDRPIIPANGAYGGPSPDNGTVLCHLYVEYATIPSLAEHDVGEGGVVDLTKGEVIKRAEATREVLATLVFSPEAAEMIGKFLMEKAQLANKRRAEQKGKGK